MGQNHFNQLRKLCMYSMFLAHFPSRSVPYWAPKGRIASSFKCSVGRIMADRQEKISFLNPGA